MRELGRNALILWLSEVLQAVVQFCIADQLDERRLLKLNSQRFLESRIEHRIAGFVGEVGEDELIFVSEFDGLVGVPIEEARDGEAKDNDGRRDKKLPAGPKRSGGNVNAA